MKTIEEKAKAYDKAIEKLRDFYRDYDTVSHLIDVKEELANLFPELCESEDERIRKGIKSILEHYKESGEVVCPYPFVSIDEALAWLKKQETSYTKRDVDDAYVEGMVFAKNELEKQGKPSDEDMKEALRTEYGKGRADAFAEMRKEWSENDERIYKVILEILNSWAKGTIAGCIIPSNTDRYINWFKGIKDKILPKQEWSEEDEELLNIIIDNVKGYDAYTGGIALKFGLHENKIKWLKSIKNRVLTKQEWNKEDEGVLFESISALQHSSHWVLADKLKSIILQNRWKPNDTQMDALNDVISSRDIKYDILSELWKDLKKLKDNSYE